MLRSVAQPTAASTLKQTIPGQAVTRFASSRARRPSLPTRVLAIPAYKTYQTRIMSTTTEASPYKIHITPENTGLLKVKQTDEAADRASALLQEDLEKHHVFFNQDGFHNHIPHHILALYGTGASPSSLQSGYDYNTSYQRPALPPHEPVLQSLFSQNNLEPYLGKEKHYPDFLRFFQHEMTQSSYEDVLKRYLFKPAGDPAGDDMLVRLFAGFLHPLIQLMYGVEWRQPAIVAEALAQTAVHGDDIGGFLVAAEKKAAASSAGGEMEMPSVLELLGEVGQSEKLRGAVRNEDGNKVRDGVLKRAKEEIIEIAGRVRVKPEEGEVVRRTAEMFDACVYVASAAAVKGGKQSKSDFFLIHHVNAAPIFVTLNAQPWLPIEIKSRILEWKIRMDLLQYAARGVPELSIDKIANYQPKNPHLSVPNDIISRLHTFPEDGHAIKLGRASLICHDLVSSLNKENKLDGVKLAINTDDLWNKVFHLIVDSVEAPGPNWVRSCGLEKAWADIPDADDGGDHHKL